MKRIAALVCALSSFSAVRATLQEEAHWDRWRLVVVVWELRAPSGEVYGTRLKTAREELLAEFYHATRPLLGHRRDRTVLAIYPEGMPAHPGASGLYESMVPSSPAQLARSWIPRMFVPPDASRRPRGVFFPGSPEKDKLDLEIRRNLTLPLVGVFPEAAETSSDEAGRPPYQESVRAVSHPPLVTAAVLKDAVDRSGISAHRFDEVFLVWVHAGDRNYDLTIPNIGIRRDYGPNAEAYYWQTSDLYGLIPDHTEDRGGEFRTGRIKLFRVVSRQAYPFPPRISILDRDSPAGHSATARWGRRWAWLDRSPLLGLLAASPLTRTATDSPNRAWKAPVPQGWRLVAGRYSLVPAGPYPMGEEGELGVPLREVLSAALGPHPKAGTFSEPLRAEMVIEPEFPASLPEYLRELAVPFPARVEARAPISVTLAPTSREGWILAGALLAVALLLTTDFLWRRRQTRSLTVVLDPGTLPETTVESPGRSAEPAFHPLRLFLEDRSGFRPWPERLEVSIAVEPSLGAVPVRERRSGKAPLLHRVRLQGSGAWSDKVELALRPRRAKDLKGRYALEGLSAGIRRILWPRAPQTVADIEVEVDPRTVNFERVRGSVRMDSVVRLSVQVSAPGRYHSIQGQQLLLPGRVRATGWEPNLADAAEVRLDPVVAKKGHIVGPGEWRRIGTLELRNPTLPEGAAWDLCVQIESLKATSGSRLEGEIGVAVDHSHKPGASPSRDLPKLTLKHGDRSTFGLFLCFSEEQGGKGSPWTVEVKVTAVCTVPESKRRETVLVRAVSVKCFFDRADAVACLDLGTHATRLLLHSVPHGLFGFCPWTQAAVAQPSLHSPGEDGSIDLLPQAFISENRDVLFGGNAITARWVHLQQGTVGRFYPSIKEMLISGNPGGVKDFKDYLGAFLQRLYRPHAESEVTALYPTRAGLTEVRIPPVAHPTLVASIPNDCPPSYLAAYREAIESSGLFEDVLFLRESEAVGLWWAHREVTERRGTGFQRVLVIDVGAGTTDAALIEVGLPDDVFQDAPRMKVLATGECNLGGKAIDEAIIQFLEGHPRYQAIRNADPLERRMGAEELKIAACRGDGRPFTLAINSAGLHETLGQPDLSEILGSGPVTRVVGALVEDSLLALVGRLAPRGFGELTSCGRIVLTGRGSQVPGIRIEVERFLGRLGLRDASFDTIEPHLLKAAVALGNLRLAQGWWTTFQASDDAVKDRLGIVYVANRRYRFLELLEPGQVLRDDQPIVGPWRSCEEWAQAHLVATQLVPGGIKGLNRESKELISRLRLGDAELQQVLRGGGGVPRVRILEAGVTRQGADVRVVLSRGCDPGLEWREREGGGRG